MLLKSCILWILVADFYDSALPKPLLKLLWTGITNFTDFNTRFIFKNGSYIASLGEKKEHDKFDTLFSKVLPMPQQLWGEVFHQAHSLQAISSEGTKSRDHHAARGLGTNQMPLTWSQAEHPGERQLVSIIVSYQNFKALYEWKWTKRKTQQLKNPPQFKTSKNECCVGLT